MMMALTPMLASLGIALARAFTASSLWMNNCTPSQAGGGLVLTAMAGAGVGGGAGAGVGAVTGPGAGADSGLLVSGAMKFVSSVASASSGVWQPVRQQRNATSTRWD